MKSVNNYKLHTNQFIFKVPKIWVVRPIKPEAGKPLRLRDEGKGKQQDVRTSGQEVVIGRLEEECDMCMRRLLWKLAEKWVDLEVLMEEIAGIEWLMQQEE